MNDQTDTPPTATIGHNSGAAPSAEDLNTRLATEYADAVTRSDQLLSGFNRMHDSIESDEAYGKAGAFAVQLGKHVANLTAAHKIEKAPFLNGGRLVDDFFFGPKRSIEAAKAHVERLQGLYDEKKRKEERRRREEADRLAREELAEKQAEALRLIEASKPPADATEGTASLPSAEAEDAIEEAIAAQTRADEAAQVAAAPVSQPVKMESAYGTVSASKVEWTQELLDKNKLDKEKLWPFIPLDAVEKALKAYVKAGGRDMPGARIFQQSKVRNR